MFNSNSFKTNENSNPNSGKQVGLFNQNQNNQIINGNNPNTTPLKFHNPGSINENNQLFGAPNNNLSSSIPQSMSSNSNSIFGINSSSNPNPSGLFGGSISANNNANNNNSGIRGIGNSAVINNQNNNIFGGSAGTSILGSSSNTSSNLFGGSNGTNSALNNLSSTNSNNNSKNDFLAPKQEASNSNNLTYGNQNISQLTVGGNSNQNSVNSNNSNSNFLGGNPNSNNNQGYKIFSVNNLNNNQTSNSLFGPSSNLNINNTNALNQNHILGNNNATSAKNNNSGLFGNHPTNSLNINPSLNPAAEANKNSNQLEQSNFLGTKPTIGNSNSFFANNTSSNSNVNTANNQSSNGLFVNIPSKIQNANQTSSLSNNIFGNNTSNEAIQNANNNLFGNKTQTPSTNLFGNNNMNASTQFPDANKQTHNIFGNANKASNISPFGNQNSANTNTNIAASSGGLFNSIQNPTTSKPIETNILFNNTSNTNINKANQNETKPIIGDSSLIENSSTIFGNNPNIGSNPTSSLFSSNNTISEKPAQTSLFGNPTSANSTSEVNKPSNLASTENTLLNGHNVVNSKNEAAKQESLIAENKSILGKTIITTNLNNNASNSLFKNNPISEKLNSPPKTDQAINSNSSSSNLNNVNIPEKTAESKAKLNRLTIYQNLIHKTPNENPTIRPITFENNFESRKNILGISRNELSERVIDAISNKMTIKEFFTKASEDVMYERNVFPSKAKSKKSETQYEIFDDGFSRRKDSYLETKYQMYLHREIFKQKQKIESKKKLNTENNASDYSDNKLNFAFGSFGRTAAEKEFYNSYKKHKYSFLVEKNFDINKDDSPLNYNLADVNYANWNNFNVSYRHADSKRNVNQKNMELIKIMNEDTFGNANHPLEMHDKVVVNSFNAGVIDNTTNNLYFGKTVPTSLVDKKQEEIDLYDPSFWESKIQNQKEPKEEEKKSLSKHLGNIKDGIHNFFSSFYQQEEAGKNALLVKNENANLNKKILSIVAEIKNKNIFLSFNAHKDATVAVLKGYIIEKLIERNMHKFSYLKHEHLLMLFKSSILVDENSLGKYEFDPTVENIIQVIVSSEKEYLENLVNLNASENKNTFQAKIDDLSACKDKEHDAIKTHNLHKIGGKSILPIKSSRLRKKSKSPGKENINRNSNNINLNNQMIIDSEEKMDKKEIDNFFPVFNNEFNLCPSIQYIYRMKKPELKSVEGFKIHNCFGKIKFKTKVDLTYLNLSEAVRIDKFEIELYPGKEIPSPGQGLNKPAKITIKQMFDERDNIEALVQRVKEKGGKFIKYEEIKGKFKFEVESWIK